ncbi:microspherule protein 1 [Parasteatoda tepidariorum]|nr:microspherule protein 1 [Parasteatoda tepidariorum]
MSIISDSSQEASNAALGANNTPVSSPNLYIKAETSDIPQVNVFRNTPDLLKTSNTATDQAQKRRSSSRSIKRKKFDDELVESSLVKTSRPRPQNVAFPLLSAAISLSSPTVAAPPSSATTSQAQPEISNVPPVEKRKPRPNPKRVKKQKNNQSHVTKDVSRWKPTDDLMLVLSVQQTNSIETVYRGVKFSSPFSLREVQERWYSLLYDASVSKPAVFAIKQLNTDIISQIRAKVLFSEEEEKLIASVPFDKGSLEVFQALLDSNASVFLPSRTAKILYMHWSLMKQYNLLKDQTAQQQIAVESLLTFSDAEEMFEDSDLQDPKDSVLEEETAGVNRKHLQEIKHYENEVPKWQVLVDLVTGVSLPDFDSKTLAVLRGRIVRYLIQSREVTFGRSAKDNTVDIDFALEGPAWKISRRQGVIKMDNNGEFYLINEAKKPIFVDGKPVLNGTKYKLNNNSVIEIAVLRFIFIVNQEAIAALKNKSTV